MNPRRSASIIATERRLPARPTETVEPGVVVPNPRAVRIAKIAAAMGCATASGLIELFESDDAIETAQTPASYQAENRLRLLLSVYGHVGSEGRPKPWQVLPRDAMAIDQVVSALAGLTNSLNENPPDIEMETAP